MKYLLVSFLFVTMACGEQNHTANEDDVKQLRYLKEVEWPKAYYEQDTLLLDRILGDDFQLIDDAGNWSDKRFELNWIKNNTYQPDSFHYEIKRLDILKNGTAIVAGTGHIFSDATETIYQSSNYFEKRNGVWKAFSSHVSGVKPGR
ncbi:MAG: DUF4440 domain-containing protein [Cyclobacteriaceae bacterium]